MWFDQMAIPVDAPNVEGAHLFLNFIMDAQNMADASNYVIMPMAISPHSRCLKKM